MHSRERSQLGEKNQVTCVTISIRTVQYCEIRKKIEVVRGHLEIIMILSK